jgi:adenylate cyclase class 2
MGIEIEAKLKVEELGEIAERLSKLGAEYLGEWVQRDVYFDSLDSSLRNSDRGLRLRRQKTSGSEKTFLAYKGAREDDKFKKRAEVEIEVSDIDLTERLLGSIGFGKVLTFEKKRRVWRFGGCEVCLDELPLLGGFVEIEGPDDDRIAEVQGDLGLADLEHIKDSYATLMDAKLSGSGRTEREAFFQELEL